MSEPVTPLSAAPLPICEIRQFVRGNVTYFVEQMIPVDGSAPWFRLAGEVVLTVAPGTPVELTLPIPLPPKPLEGAVTPAEAFDLSLAVIEKLLPELKAEAARFHAERMAAHGLSPNGLILTGTNGRRKPKHH